MARRLTNQQIIGDALLVVGEVCLILQDRETAYLYLNDALQIFERLRNSVRKHQALHVLAGYWVEVKAFDKGLELSEVCYAWYHEQNDAIGIIGIQRLKGNVFRMQLKYQQALEVLQDAISVARETGLNDTLGSVYVSLALVHRNIGDSKRSIVAFDTACKHYQAAGDRLGVAIATMNKGKTLLNQKVEDYQGSRGCFLKAMREFSRLGQTLRLGNAWNGMGASYAREGLPDKAEICYRKALALQKQANVTDFSESVFRNLALFYEAQGNIHKAIEYAEQALEYAAMNGEVGIRLECLADLSVLYRKAENHQKALHYLDRYIDLREEMVSPEKLNKAVRQSVTPTLKRLRSKVKQGESRVAQLQAQLVEKERILMELAIQALSATQKKASEQEVNSPDKTTDELSNRSNQTNRIDSRWEQLVGQISKVDSQFYHDLAHRFTNLSMAELKVCSLLRMGMSSKEIAEILVLSVRTVDCHRLNIRKKLNLPRSTRLASYIASI